MIVDRVLERWETDLAELPSGVYRRLKDVAGQTRRRHDCTAGVIATVTDNTDGQVYYMQVFRAGFTLLRESR